METDTRSNGQLAIKKIGTNEVLKKLKESILIHKPVLRQIINDHGDKYISQYAESYHQLSISKKITSRQIQLLNTFNKYVADRLDQSVADQATQQLKKSYFVSTTDHHGPLIHPFFVNGNLISAASHLSQNPQGPNNVIVFSCANVSLNNSSFPRGLLFHRLEKNKAHMERLSFYPASDRLCPVYGLRPYTSKDIDRLVKQINNLNKKGKLSNKTTADIREILTGVMGTEKILTTKNFTDQVTKINFQLWQIFFRRNNLNAMNLIYIDQEGLVNELLLNYHLDKNTLINKILFNNEVRKLWLLYFDGIIGSFNTADKIGTHFFWAIPPNEKYRQQLWYKDGRLQTSDGSYSLDLNPQTIRQAILNKEIMPGMALTFTILAFYYGLKCLGGFSQVNYLSEMKASFLKLITDINDIESREISQGVITNELCGEVTLAFIQSPGQFIHPATFIDLLLYGDRSTWQKITQLMKQIKLEEALDPLMPELYRIVYSDQERLTFLTDITPEHIIQETKLGKKIHPCAFLV